MQYKAVAFFTAKKVAKANKKVDTFRPCICNQNIMVLSFVVNYPVSRPTNIDPPLQQHSSKNEIWKHEIKNI